MVQGHTGTIQVIDVSQRSLTEILLGLWLYPEDVDAGFPLGPFPVLVQQDHRTLLQQDGGETVDVAIAHQLPYGIVSRQVVVE